MRNTVTLSCASYTLTTANESRGDQFKKISCSLSFFIHAADIY